MKPCSLIAALVVFLLAAANCSWPTAPDTPIPIVRLHTSAFGGFIEPTRLVVRDEAAWRDAWATAWKYNSEPPSLPGVDFSKDMVVIAAQGAQPSSGYSVTIESAAEAAGRVALRVRTLSPGPRCGVLTVITHPLDIVQLTRHDAVTFDERKQIEGCS